jgi:hypothetical protein
VSQEIIALRCVKCPKNGSEFQSVSHCFGCTSNDGVVESEDDVFTFVYCNYGTKKEG